jgi:hypothetical protein
MEISFILNFNRKDRTIIIGTVCIVKKDKKALKYAVSIQRKAV